MVRAIKQECFWDVFLWTNNFRRFTKPEKNDDVGPRVANKAEKQSFVIICLQNKTYYTELISLWLFPILFFMPSAINRTANSEHSGI